MKLALQQLEQQLAKSLAPIYLLSSDEILLVQEATALIRGTAQKKGFSERLLLTVEPGVDWEKSLYSEAHSLSLFASSRIIELHLGETKPNASTGKVLENYATNPPENTLLIICTHKLDAKLEKSNWYKAIDKIGVVLQIWPIQAAQLPAWIKQRGQKLGLNFAPEAAKLIADHVEGNLLAAAQEIEKIALLYSANTTPKIITHDDIEKALSDSARFTIFDLVDSALAGNRQRSLRILETLKAEDAEPVLILWAFTRELRTLSELANQLRQGISLNTLFTQFRIWEKRQPPVRQFLQKHSLEACWEFLLQAGDIDRVIKGGKVGNVWDELQKLAVQF